MTKFHNSFKSKLFPIRKQTQEKRRPLNLDARLKLLTPKQLLQRLPITVTQVKTGNTSEKLFNEIRQIIYFLYRAK